MVIRADINNDRPISVLSVVSRIFEKIVHDTINGLSNRQDKFCLKQFAFQKLHRTLTCLLNVIEPLFQYSDEGKVKLRIFLNL